MDTAGFSQKDKAAGSSFTPSSAEVMNVWSYTSTLSYAFIASKGTETIKSNFTKCCILGYDAVYVGINLLFQRNLLHYMQQVPLKSR
jgi:hypothetical protein